MYSMYNWGLNFFCGLYYTASHCQLILLKIQQTEQAQMSGPVQWLSEPLQIAVSQTSHFKENFEPAARNLI